MYIAAVPNRGSPPAVLLRESFREGGKVHSRTLLNITSWAPERIEAMKRLLRGEYDNHLDGFECESGKIYGVLYVLKELLIKLGISKALGQSNDAKLCEFLICARIAAQGSRLSAVRWAKAHAVEEVLNLKEFDEDDLYDALSWIASRQETIEENLYQQYLKQHAQPPTLILYDITSSYLEGLKNELAEYGYNRDGKKGKKQILIGLLTDLTGEPLAVRVFKGNLADSKTVKDQIQALVTLFKVEHVVFVGDRGMIKSSGKELLAEHGFEYITALTDPQIRSLLKRQVLQLELFDENVQEIEHENIRYVLRCNPLIKRKEQSRRENKLKKLEDLIADRNSYVAQHPKARLESGLRKINSWARRHKLHSFVILSLNGSKIELRIDADALAKDALLDGCYVLETDVIKDTLDTKQVHSSYLSLQNVERDFRTMKTGLLEVRPIFLRKGNRTKAHVFIIFLTLKLSRYIQEKLTTLNLPHFSVDDAVLALNRLTLLNFKNSHTVITKLPNPDLLQQKILTAFGTKIPNYKCRQGLKN